MSAPKVRAEDYIQFLIATPRQATCTEAARVQPDAPDPAAHDAFARLLTRLEPDPDELWREARPQVRPGGILVLDDSVLDKPYARKVDTVHWQFSGKHAGVVKGIGLLTLLWTDGDRHVPCDWAVYDRPNDGLTKNDLFRRLLGRAHEHGMRPECVCFDGWYASLANLKHLRSLGWRWQTRLKHNRAVRVDFGDRQPISGLPIPPEGREVHLPGYGPIRVFRSVAPDGDVEYWATGDLGQDALGRQRLSDYSWRIEEYHRGLKQFCGVERCQARRGRAQRTHIGLSIRAFLRLEVCCFARKLTWFQAKWDIIRDAVRAYLAQPLYALP
jgi:putative transposase